MNFEERETDHIGIHTFAEDINLAIKHRKEVISGRGEEDRPRHRIVCLFSNENQQ